MNRNIMPKIGDQVWSDEKKAKGRITGFERDGRVRVKFGNGPGRPHIIPGEDVFSESQLSYYGKIIAGAAIKWVIQGSPW